MQLFDAPDYISYLQFLLGGDQPIKRGVIKGLADKLRVHPTYISQVLRRKAHLSPDQAFRLCSVFGLTADETDFFLDMLSRDRSGDQLAAEHFQKRLDERKLARLQLKEKWRAGDLSTDQEALYYESWIPQAIHLLCRLPGTHTLEAICRRLQISESHATNVLKILTEMKLVSSEQEGSKRVYRCDVPALHLDKGSMFANRAHINWRLKTASDLMGHDSSHGFHFSSLAATSAAVAKKVHELNVKVLNQTRDLILNSEDQDLYVYSVDFYPLTTADPMRIQRT